MKTITLDITEYNDLVEKANLNQELIDESFKTYSKKLEKDLCEAVNTICDLRNELEKTDVHNSYRFRWYYRLFNKVTKWVGCKKINKIK